MKLENLKNYYFLFKEIHFCLNEIQVLKIYWFYYKVLT